MIRVSNYLTELKGIAIGVLMTLNIDVKIAEALSILMLIDLAFGVTKAIYLPQLKFEFKELFKGLTVKFMTLTLPLIFALTVKHLGMGDLGFLISVVLKLFLIAETISIYNSFLSIKKGEPIKQTDLITVTIEKIQSYFKATFDKIIGGLK